MMMGMALTQSTTTALRESPKPIRRRWRFERDPVIEAFADLYCATPRELTRYLLFKEPTENQVRGKRYLIQRIKEYDPHATMLTEQEFFWNSSTSLIGLSDKGAKIAREKMGIENARAFDTKDSEHEFLLSCVHIRLREYAKANGYGFQWTRNIVDHQKRINPDAIAVLITPQGRFTYAVEIERQSYNQDHLKKGERYKAVYGHPECVDLFGAQKIRVIFVTLSDRRMTTMLEKYSKDYPHRMFWFTTVDQVLHNIGTHIFFTPKDYKDASYSLDLSTSPVNCT